MGVRLIVEVLDFAPANLTPRERWALVVMAEGARDTTRVCWPGVENDERFIRRCRLSRSQRYAVIKALIEKGVLENVRRGQKHVRASYRIAVMAPANAVLPEPQDAPDESEAPNSQGPGLQDAENAAPDSQRPDSQDAEDQGVDSQRPGFESSASRFTDLSVPVYRTPSPQSPQSPHFFKEDDGALFPNIGEPKAPAKSTKQPKRKATKGKSEPDPENQRINKFADLYYDAAGGLTDHKKVRSVVKAALARGTTEEDLERGLLHQATDGEYSLTLDSLRVSINRSDPRRTNQNRSSNLRVVGGSRQEVPDAEYWSKLTPEELRNIL